MDSSSSNEIERDLNWHLLEGDSAPGYEIALDRLSAIRDEAAKHELSEHKKLAAHILEYAVECIYPEIIEDENLKYEVEDRVQRSVVSVDKMTTDLTIEDVQNFIIKTYREVNISGQSESPLVLDALNRIWEEYKNAYKDIVISISEKQSYLALWQIIHRAYPGAKVQTL